MALAIFRADRRTEFWTARTPESVGPGSYAGSLPISPKQVEGKKQAKRAISTGHSGRGYQPVRRAPGPGTYELTRIEGKKGSRAESSSFASRQRRPGPIASGSTAFSYSSSYQTPGPGYYDLPEPKYSPQVVRKSLAFHINPTPVSIPQQRKYQPRDRGPAYYNPSDVVTKGGLQATDFSKAKGRTSLWEPSNIAANPYPSKSNPGPAHYHLVKTEEEALGQAIFQSKVKRLCDIKATNPGPGAYETQEITTISTGEQPAFGSAVERGQTWAHDLTTPYTRPERIRVPGVGTYSVDETRSRSAVRDTKLAKKKKPAFLSSALRDLSEVKSDQRPGPGEYEYKESMPDSGRFLSGEKRFAGLFTPREGPSPGEYYRSPDSSVQQQQTSFKRTTERFQPLVSGNPMITLVGGQQAPSVGQYNVQRSWKRKEMRVRDLYAETDFPVSFDSAAERFSHNEPFPGLQTSNTPGPGHYLKSKLLRPEGKAVSARAPRFQSPGNYCGSSETGPEVGPGCYQLPESLGKTSFNLTIETDQRA